MNEMLGNQYFLVRKYYSAAQAYEDVLKENPTNYAAAKKLVICYTQINKPAEALNLLVLLLNSSINLLLSNNPAMDDCPCPELIKSISSGSIKYADNFITQYILGILWAYCSIKTSIHFFKEALKVNPGDENIKKALHFIENFNKNFQSTIKEYK